MSEKRWLILGTRPTATEIAIRCRKSGILAEPVSAVELALRDDVSRELSRVGSLDVSVFTSRTAVGIINDYAPRELKDRIVRSRCYAIGPSTSELLRSATGVSVVKVPTRGDSEGLVELLRSEKLGRVGLFSSVKRSNHLRDFLAHNSSILFEPKLYDLRPKQVAISVALRRWSIAEIAGFAFTCSTAVEAIPATLEVPESVRTVAMGPRTAATLRRAGYQPIVPSRYDIGGIVNVILKLHSNIVGVA